MTKSTATKYSHTEYRVIVGTESRRITTNYVHYVEGQGYFCFAFDGQQWFEWEVLKNRKVYW